jgi:hypothetical protein
VIVHKVTTLPDTALTAKPLNPDDNWTGVETADKVALFARNGALQLVASLHTDHAGDAQYLVSGLLGGRAYRVSRGGETVVASQQILDGDNTLYFEAPAGYYQIFPLALSKLVLQTDFLQPILPGTSYRYDFNIPGYAGAYVWTVAEGALPPGLTLTPAGVLSGVTSQAGDYTVTIQAQDAAAPASLARVGLTLHVWSASSTLTLGVAGATATQALFRYGRRGLNALQRCMLTLSDVADFSNIAENFVDQGGAAVRSYVAGTASPLAAGTVYYLQVSCGVGQASDQFITTAATAPQALSIPIAVSTIPYRNVATVQVEYGTSPQLGGSVAQPCTGSCRIWIPAMSGTLLYVKRVFLDASAQIVAQSAVLPFLVP